MTEDGAVWYKEIYRIIPKPRRHGDDDRYSVACVVERYEDGVVMATHAYDGDPSPRARGPHDQALAKSIQLGKEIIDGKYPDHTPP